MDAREGDGSNRGLVAICLLSTIVSCGFLGLIVWTLEKIIALFTGG
jgi:hypothetical protein